MIWYRPNRWRTTSGALSSFSFDPGTNTLYEYGEERLLVEREPLSGTPRWQVSTRFGQLLATADNVFAADESVRAFDASTGALMWSAPVAGADACPVGVTDEVVTVVSTN